MTTDNTNHDTFSQCPIHDVPECPTGCIWLPLGKGPLNREKSFPGYYVAPGGKKARGGQLYGALKSFFYFEAVPETTITAEEVPPPGETFIAAGTRVHNVIETLKETAPHLLKAASDTILERGAQRDLPEGERSMARAVQAFNALTGQKLSETDGWLFMTILKISRHQGGSFHRDDLQDGIAYLALALEAELKDQL